MAEIVIKKRSKKYGGDISYYNMANAFDTETTSLPSEYEYKGCNHLAYAYMYAFMLDGVVHKFRRIEDVLNFFCDVIEEYDISINKRIVFYVHNLSFDLQFIYKYFEWEEMFANGGRRNIIKAITKSGIEFRCSLALTNTTLANVGEDVGIEKTKDLDYELIRTYSTELDELEDGYVDHDVYIVEALIKEKLKSHTIANIPMTSTGYTRERVRDVVLSDAKYKKDIRKLTMEYEEYKILRKAYMGGYTHANPEFVFQKQYDVTCADLGSSYPAVLCQHKFPIGKGFTRDISSLEEYKNYSKTFCIVGKITLKNVQCVKSMAYISKSKCFDVQYMTVDSHEDMDESIDNGRVWMCKELSLYATDVDFAIINECYEFSDISFDECWLYKRGYLPKPLVECIVNNYKHKTMYKNVAGKEDIYRRTKADNNCLYGMMVTDVIRPTYELTEDGYISETEIGEVDEMLILEKHNKDFKRFTFYAWGVYCSAYARASLFSLSFKFHKEDVEDYYCDTDSHYFKNSEKALNIIEKENKLIAKRMEKAMKHHNIDYDEVKPKCPKGDVYHLGLWEVEDTYDEFKSLGAKRYACVTDGKLKITCSGINKKMGAKYIQSIGGIDRFEKDLIIPPEYSGRKVARYFDDEFTIKVVDYKGDAEVIRQKGWVHLESVSSHIHIADSFESFVDKLLIKA